MVDRKQLAIDFAQSLNHPEIEKIILFGSVARGEDTEESDIDILIITSKKSDKEHIRGDVYSRVTDFLLSSGEYISVKFKAIEHYNKYKNFSFFSNVDNEGVIIG
jgi:predicted nucleotidyltransferase